jgi:hypothetical protein
MTSMRATALAGLGIVATLAASVPGAVEAARPTWLELFDGRSTEGWRMSGPGSFTVERGALVTHGGMGLRPPGRWNRYLIRVVDQRYTVFLNGARVTQFTGERARIGHVGLQNHDSGSRVEFRRVLLRPLAFRP